MGQYGAHLGPTRPRWAPYWPHELCYLGSSGKPVAGVEIRRLPTVPPMNPQMHQTKPNQNEPALFAELLGRICLTFVEVRACLITFHIIQWK